MKIIVPMAGKGKRMRPHTLTTPKPLIAVAGKSIVQRLIEDISNSVSEKIDEIAFITGDFGTESEDHLRNIAAELGAKATISHQVEALGTAHAIMCAKNSLQGKVVIAFADTLFKADFTIDEKQDGIVWVQKVADPRQFGVVKVDSDNVITDFAEKPETFVSDLAIIGIYYFRDGENLKNELQFLLDNDIRDKGEFQITSALENMKNKGLKLTPGEVSEWLDCGNKDSTVHTNKRVLEFTKKELKVPSSVLNENSVIIQPCYIGENVKLKDAVVGPYTSIGNNTIIEKSVLNNSIVQSDTEVRNAILTNSMIGNSVVYEGQTAELSLGDFNVHKMSTDKITGKPKTIKTNPEKKRDQLAAAN